VLESGNRLIVSPGTRAPLRHAGRENRAASERR
jgi:hypothetical protein